jgi:hypothetical protein
MGVRRKAPMMQYNREESPVVIFVMPSVWDLSAGLLLYVRHVQSGVAPIVIDGRCPDVCISSFVKKGYRCIGVGTDLNSVDGVEHVYAQKFLELAVQEITDPALSSIAQAGLEFLRGSISDTSMNIGAYFSLLGISGVIEDPRNINAFFREAVEEQKAVVEQSVKKIVRANNNALTIRTMSDCSLLEDSFFCGVLRSRLNNPMVIVSRHASKIYAIPSGDRNVFSLFLEKSQGVSRWEFDPITFIYKGALRGRSKIKEKLMEAYQASVQELSVEAILSPYGLTLAI